MKANNLTIGEIAALSGVKVTTVRFYEGRGLLPRPARSAGGRRAYEPNDVRKLTFIRYARELGFALDDIQALLRLAEHPEQDCADADVIARQHLATVQDKVAQLERLRRELEVMIAACDNSSVAECRILDALGVGGGQGRSP